MKVLIVNPIIYTSETRDIKKVNTIKDTMIYDLCLGFMAKGIDVTLVACEDYKPASQEEYPFKIKWVKAKNKKLFPPNVLPYCPQIKSIIKSNSYDLIITSEVFSLNSLMLAIHSPKNLIVWHELAKHNKIFKSIPSKIWYSFVAKLFFKKVLIVPRSIEAKNFISKYCKNVSDIIIDHGVNLQKFTFSEQKENYFAVSSQLIERKQIDKIIIAFNSFLKKYDNSAKLYIMGEGDEKQNLENLVNDLAINSNVTFTGKLQHQELIEYLKKAKAMLVYTRKDNNMVSIVESIAVGTPIITTSVPYNASYIKANNLGIVKDCWNEDDLFEISNNNIYIKNCLDYRPSLACESKVEEFIVANDSMNRSKV